MTKPLGYYGLQIDADVEAAIDEARIEAQVEALEYVANGLANRLYHDVDDADFVTYDESLLPKLPRNIYDIAMIRALCDRIEQRLMEQAK